MFTLYNGQASMRAPDARSDFREKLRRFERTRIRPISRWMKSFWKSGAKWSDSKSEKANSSGDMVKLAKSIEALTLTLALQRSHDRRSEQSGVASTLSIHGNHVESGPRDARGGEITRHRATSL